MVTQTTYKEDIESWRAQSEATLRADDGWLTVAGLFWLTEGHNSIGSHPDCVVHLPEGPPSIGSLQLETNQVTFLPTVDNPAHINGIVVHEPTGLRTETTGTPDLLTVGGLTLFIIARGDRVGVRLRDKNSLARQQFAGRIWFPITEQYCLGGVFVPYNPPKSLTITNVLGDTHEQASPGYVTFTLDDQTYTLDVASQSKRGLFIVFRDSTAGHETYPAARFLYTLPPKNGAVTLDFNRAVSPPCAFTDFATCPLPPPQNRLPISILAGEQYVGHK